MRFKPEIKVKVAEFSNQPTSTVPRPWLYIVQKLLVVIQNRTER